MPTYTISLLTWSRFTNMRCAFLSTALLATAAVAFTQDLSPQSLAKPPVNSWPTYNGDYSGRRHSSLSQITSANAAQLSLAWAFQTNEPGPVKASPLLWNGVLYLTIPDHVWAVDAITGREIWQYTYPKNRGFHIGHRGVALYKDWLYFETPDDHLVCLNAKNGTLRWNVVLADVGLGYWATMAPLVVKNHVLVGISGDFDNVRGFVRAIDPETGDTQWNWFPTPPAQTPGQPTGGTTWMTGTYDPDLDLLYWGTGNPTPVLTGKPRPGDNLYTCSIVALNPDTGKLVWAFQPSPHDTHDWDAVEIPMLVDAPFGSDHHKLLLQASRNGYFFVLDRTNGKALLTAPYEETNWSSGVNAAGEPIAKPEKAPSAAGTLVEPDAIGATNWMSPSFDPQTGLLFVDTHQSFSLYYAMSNGKPEGFGGRDLTVWSECFLRAIDYQTGKSRWVHPLGGGWDWAGVLSTDGGLVFTGDVHGNVLGLDAGTGKTLWHTFAGGQAEGPPITYELDGRQYLLVGAHGVMFAFALPEQVQ